MKKYKINWKTPDNKFKGVVIIPACTRQHAINQIRDYVKIGYATIVYTSVRLIKE